MLVEIGINHLKCPSTLFLANEVIMTDKDKDAKNQDETGIAINEAFNVVETEDTEALLKAHKTALENLPDTASELERSVIMLDIASAHLALEKKAVAWNEAKACFAVFVKNEDWQNAVEACSVLFQCELKDSITALANGIWLAVTFPIDPGTTIAMLQHVIDETPDNSDGAAVAAITAHYIADMRAEDEKAESLKFLTTQMVAAVAKRHSQVTEQDMLEFWIERMELKDPAVFLPKLALVLGAMVNEQWWFDRDKLRKLIPDN